MYMHGTKLGKVLAAKCNATYLAVGISWAMPGELHVDMHKIW